MPCLKQVCKPDDLLGGKGPAAAVRSGLQVEHEEMRCTCIHLALRDSGLLRPLAVAVACLAHEQAHFSPPQTEQQGTSSARRPVRCSRLCSSSLASAYEGPQDSVLNSHHTMVGRRTSQRQRKAPDRFAPAVIEDASDALSPLEPLGLPLKDWETRRVLVRTFKLWCSA